MNFSKNNLKWRDGRVVEGARLESVYTVKGIKGSNPFLSANYIKIQLWRIFCRFKVLNVYRITMFRYSIFFIKNK